MQMYARIHDVSTSALDASEWLVSSVHKSDTKLVPLGTRVAGKHQCYCRESNPRWPTQWLVRVVKHPYPELNGHSPHSPIFFLEAPFPLYPPVTLWSFSGRFPSCFSAHVLDSEKHKSNYTTRINFETDIPPHCAHITIRNTASRSLRLYSVATRTKLSLIIVFYTHI
jgi:hypothetical protein